jgi:hypothetical protein
MRKLKDCSFLKVAYQQLPLVSDCMYLDTKAMFVEVSIEVNEFQEMSN